MSVWLVLYLVLVAGPVFGARVSPSILVKVCILCLAGGLPFAALAWCTGEFLYRKHAAVAP